MPPGPKREGCGATTAGRRSRGAAYRGRAASSEDHGLPNQSLRRMRFRPCVACGLIPPTKDQGMAVRDLYETRAVRFMVIGVLNTGIHLSIVAALTNFLNSPQVISNVAAYLSASSISFIANSLWTFNKTIAIQRYYRFHLVGTLGVCVSITFGMLADVFDWHYFLTVFLTGLGIPVISFVLHKKFTFS